jgi:hypothetical protein
LELVGKRMNESLTLGSKARELVAHFRTRPIGNKFDIHETPRALHQPYLLGDGTPANKFFVEITGVFNTAELLINQTGLTHSNLDLMVRLQRLTAMRPASSASCDLAILTARKRSGSIDQPLTRTLIAVRPGQSLLGLRLRRCCFPNRDQPSMLKLSIESFGYGL